MADSNTLAAAAVKLAAAPGATVATLLKGLASVDAQGAKAPVTLPKAVVVTAEQRTALALLAEQTGKVEWPTERRELTEAEQAQFTELLESVKTVKALISDLEQKALRPALFNDLDRRLEAEGVAGPDTPRDKSGFYLVEAQGKGFKRSYTAGTPSADVDVLQGLVAEGLLDQADFLAVTRQTRVIDEAKFLRFVAKKPEKLGVLRRAVRYVRSASVSLKLG